MYVVTKQRIFSRTLLRYVCLMAWAVRRSVVCNVVASYTQRFELFCNVLHSLNFVYTLS